MLGMIANPHRNKGMCQERRNSPDSRICFPDQMIPDDHGYDDIDFKALLKLALIWMVRETLILLII